MKKKFLVGCGCFALLLFVLIWMTTPSKELVYVQEYIPGNENIKGNVDVEFWESLGEEFEIGANEDGYAVFKNPRKAMWKLYDEYGDGIRRIKKENFLLGPYFLNYHMYAIYGLDVPMEDPYKDQVNVVCRFVDLYENSFSDGM